MERRIVSDYEGNLGNIGENDLPFAVRQLFSVAGNHNDMLDFDWSGMGPGRDSMVTCFDNGGNSNNNNAEPRHNDDA